MYLHRRQFLITPAALAAAPGASAAPRRLLIPRVSEKSSLADSYPAQLLEQALAAAGFAATLASTPGLIPQSRALQELAQRSRRLDVVWTMTSREREQQALPIRVPMFKGLFGWRLLLATPELASELRQVQSLAELRRYRLVQGLQWPDTDILAANGLPVIVTSAFEAMFQQLRLGRADAFPRAIEEVWWELERHGEGLVVVPEVCLHYPTAVYYFVAPGDTELAQAIETGLARLRASGAFDRLFLKHHGDDIARARLGQRRVIELANPQLPPLTPLEKAELWFRP
jgi:ABC-type amino acid transport substrate-binding protein